MRGIIFLFVAVVGCSFSHPNVTGSISRRNAEAVWARAEFEFRCERERIHLTRLAPSQIGATGCGRRATYISSGGGWALNSTITEGGVHSEERAAESMATPTRRDPTFAFSEQDGRTRGMRVIFRSIDSAITVTYAPEVQQELRVVLASSSAIPLSACNSFVIRSGDHTEEAALNQEQTAEVAIERFALLAGQRSRAEFCGRTWLLQDADRGAIVRMREEIARIQTQPDEPAPAAAEPSVPASIRAVLDSEAQLIRACVNQDGPITLEVRWSASAEVVVDVTSHDDPALDECVAAALPAWTLRPTVEGRLVHVLRSQMSR